MTTVPKFIFQTHKSKEYILSKPKVVRCLLSWKKHTEYKRFFYTDQMCDTFMKKHFQGRVYDAYIKLPISVMKADLWRYCILYTYGGIYADTDTICKANPRLFLNSSLLTVAPENKTHLCQWVFSALPSSPILKCIIDLSVERILTQKRIHGEHIIHYLTGPGVFTDGIEKYLQQNNKPVFQDKKDYYRYPDASVLCVFNPENFHKNVIQHLFTGQDDDGWKNERDRLFK